MSDDVTTEDPKKRPKGKKPEVQATPTEKVHVEPVPRNMAVFEWVEQLFNGEQEFPATIEVREGRGKGYQTNGPKLRQWTFQPTNSKPDREKLVKIANEMTSRMQVDCDVKQKAQVYALCAINFTRDSEPYDRAIIQFKPGQAYRLGENGDIEEEDEDASIEKRFSVQALGHNKAMFETTMEGLMGIIDRQDRTVERLLQRQDKMEERHFRMFDMLERALDLQQEREARRRKDELWTKGVEKGLELATAIAPPIVNAIAGKSVIPQPTHPDVAELQKFLRRTNDGGKLTDEQATKLFGLYKEDGECVQPGALTPMQISTLFRVAGGQQPQEDLDKLLPGGECEISQDQMMQLQMIFADSMEQVLPLVFMFQARRTRREQGQ